MFALMLSRVPLLIAIAVAVVALIALTLAVVDAAMAYTPGYYMRP